MPPHPKVCSAFRTVPISAVCLSLSNSDRKRLLRLLSPESVSSVRHRYLRWARVSRTVFFGGLDRTVSGSSCAIATPRKIITVHRFWHVYAIAHQLIGRIWRCEIEIYVAGQYVFHIFRKACR